MIRKFASLIPGAALAAAMIASGVSAATLAPNQTLGFGNDRVLTFTYGQNFSCIH